MRGKVTGYSAIDSRLRITPAYAGKSSGATSPACPSWDHPRLCGEKHIINNYILKEPGSPPPMRGKGYGAG